MVEPSSGMTKTNGKEGDLSVSERHRLLAVEQRRLVLEILTEEFPPVDLEALAAEIAARETESSTVDAKTVRRVVITLHHAHLPALAAAGILEYDPESNRIDPDRPGRVSADAAGRPGPRRDVACPRHGGSGVMELVMCTACGEFIPAPRGKIRPWNDECPSCGGTEFEHDGSETYIRIGE